MKTLLALAVLATSASTVAAAPKTEMDCVLETARIVFFLDQRTRGVSAAGAERQIKTPIDLRMLELAYGLDLRGVTVGDLSAQYLQVCLNYVRSTKP